MENLNKAVAEVKAKVSDGASFYPVACAATHKYGVTYSALVNAYHGTAMPMPEVYNAHGTRVV